MVSASHMSVPGSGITMLMFIMSIAPASRSFERELPRRFHFLVGFGRDDLAARERQLREARHQEAVDVEVDAFLHARPRFSRVRFAMISSLVRCHAALANQVRADAGRARTRSPIAVPRQPARIISATSSSTLRNVSSS